MSKKWDKRWLRMAREIASWSKDPSSKIGSVAVKDNRLVAHGYNGFPSVVEDRSEWLHDRDTKLRMMIHAEMNLILDASRTARSLEGSTVYVYGLPPCSRCATHLLGAGVVRIVYVDTRGSRVWLYELKMTIDIISKSKLSASDVLTIYMEEDL